MAMRWTTAVAVVSQGVEAHIEDHTQKAGKARELLYLLRQIGPPETAKKHGGGATFEPPPSRPGKRPQPGTIPDRVLDIVGESEEDSVTLAHILAAKHGAKASLVKTAVRGLVKSGHLIATGATHSRRFGLPTKRKGAR